MAKLFLDKSVRYETDQSIIDNLKRKGWAVLIDPIILPEELSEKEIEERSVQNLLAEQQRNIIARIAAGYNVLPEEFILSLHDEDRVLFTQIISLVREALDLGLITNDTVQTITDINGQEITLSTLRFRQIMVGYGMYYKSLWDQMV